MKITAIKKIEKSLEMMLREKNSANDRLIVSKLTHFRTSLDIQKP